MSWKVIQVWLKNMSNIVKGIRHRVLECSPNILQAKREFIIRKQSPRTDECDLVLIGWENVDLIITRKSIHKGKNLTPCIIINDLIDERGGIVILRIGSINITIINTNTNLSLLLIHRNNIRNPLC